MKPAEMPDQDATTHQSDGRSDRMTRIAPIQGRLIHGGMTFIVLAGILTIVAAAVAFPSKAFSRVPNVATRIGVELSQQARSARELRQDLANSNTPNKALEQTTLRVADELNQVVGQLSR